MRNTVHNVGKAGIVRDLKPHLLPSEFWSDGRNVRFDPQKVKLMGGVQEARAKTGLLNAGIVTSTLQSYLIYTDTVGDVYSWDGTTEYKITRSTGGVYLEDADHLFKITSFNGFGLLNNGVDVPQEWDPSVGSNLLTALSHWDSTWTAKNIRPYKAFLIALNMQEGADLYPHKLRWSHPAEPGAVPISWDDTDPTKEAGSYDFPDTNRGKLVDGKEMGNDFYVYKENSVWVLRYVGGSKILTRDLVMDSVGLYVPRSLASIPKLPAGTPGQFFAGRDNFYIMDGYRVTPVFENVFRDEILKLADPDVWVDRSFACVNYQQHEVWFCIPEVGEEYPTLAFCLNYHTGSSSIRELYGTTNITSEVGFQGSTTTVTDDIPYSDEIVFSDGVGFYDTMNVAVTPVMLEAVPALEKAFYADLGTVAYDGISTYSGYVMREALATIKNDSRNEKADIVDYNSRKLVTSVIPKLYPSSAALLELGTQENENGAITWLSAAIDLNASIYRTDLPQPLSGRFFTFKYSSLPGQSFELGGFDYEVDVLGEF